MKFLIPFLLAFAAASAYSVQHHQQHHKVRQFLKHVSLRNFVHRNVPKNDAGCDFCKEILGYVWNKDVLDQAVDALDQECNLIPEVKIKAACHKFIEDFVKAGVDYLLQEYTVEKVCQAMGACTSFERIFGRHSKMTDSTARCEGCKLGVSMVDAMFKSEEVVKNLEAIVTDHICTLMGAQMKECQEAVTAFVPGLMGTLSELLSTDQLCVKTAVCVN